MGTTRPTNSSINVDLASIVNNHPRIQRPGAQYSPKRQNIVASKKRFSASTRVASIGDLQGTRPTTRESEPGARTRLAL